MKFCLAVLVFTTLSKSVFSQAFPQNPNVTDAKGLRQGKWTTFQAKDWQQVDKPEKAAYFRTISYQDDVPIDTVRDYWITGEIQSSCLLKADRPYDILHGKCKYFRKDGTLSAIRVFENGVRKSELLYDPAGILITSGDFQKLLARNEEDLLTLEDEVGKNHTVY